MGIHITEDTSNENRTLFQTLGTGHAHRPLCRLPGGGVGQPDPYGDLRPDDPEQAVKLRVRDAVLEYLRPALADCGGKSDAAQTLSGALPEVETAARSAAEGRDVTVTLGEEYYPTRVYDGLSLPAGRYTSLRVTLGEGRGHNWWCVVYPPLCVTAAEASEQAIETLKTDTAQIITESDGYVLKFKILELWGELTEWLG